MRFDKCWRLLLVQSFQGVLEMFKVQKVEHKPHEKITIYIFFLTVTKIRIKADKYKGKMGIKLTFIQLYGKD